jgi:hypothetical protein
VIGFEPQVFVIAERGFAGGLAFMYGGFSNSERNQRLAVERWSRQDVPVVVAVASQLPAFSGDYPIVSRWVDAHYRTERQSAFGGNKDIVVFVRDRATRTGIHAPTGLPCFR